MENGHDAGSDVLRRSSETNVNSESEISGKTQTVITENTKESFQTQPQPQSQLSEEEIEKQIEDTIPIELSRDVLLFNPIYLKKTYPKVYNKIVKYIEDMIGMIPEEEMIFASILYSTRNLVFKFFDTESLWINITGKEENWSYTNIFNKDIVAASDLVNRSTAEYQAYMLAFKMLEKSL